MFLGKALGIIVSAKEIM